MLNIRVGRHNEPDAVYVGRPSALGNPFVIGRDGNRDEVCDRYEAWLRKQVAAKNEAVLDALRQIYRLGKRPEGVTLGCYCAPLRCHANSIKRVIEELAAQ